VVRVAAVVVVILVAAWGWTTYSRHRTEHRLAAVASELAGRKVGVKCQGFWASMVDIGQRSGEVDFPPGRPPDHMFLVRGVCSRLKHFLGSSSHHDLDCLTAIDWEHWSFDTGFDAPCERHARGDAEAVNTLAHESMHLRGIQGEAAAQCLAIQADAWTVVRLGGTPDQGLAVARFVLALQPGVPQEYQFGSCPLPATPSIPPS
jgi:hypothetical protein